ncbi:MAG: cation diffusion facilitator family transporter [Chloroflexi bacterium]|nr:cation diffusion facilitator family transporter [Chloroflexota bacterium]
MKTEANLSRRERYLAVRRVILVVLAVGLALAAAKVVYGSVTGSLGMVADGLHSVIDAAAGIVALIAIYLAARPPDPKHPYGYERYEPLAAIGIAATMGVAVVQILERTWEHLGSREIPEVTILSFAIMLSSVGFRAGLAVWERQQGRRFMSGILAADWRRGIGDALVSLSVVLGLLAALIGFPVLDAAVSVGIAGVIGWTAWTIVRDSSRALTDAATGDLPRIASVASTVEGVQSCHQVRARGVAGMVRVDLHIAVDPSLQVSEAHRIAEEVERRVKVQVGGTTEVLVHVGAATMHPN